MWLLPVSLQQDFFTKYMHDKIKLYCGRAGPPAPPPWGTGVVDHHYVILRVTCDDI